MCDIWLAQVALPSVQLTIQWTSIWRDQMIFLACILFVIADYVMTPQRTVSFKCLAIHVHMRAQRMKSQKANSLENRNVVWIGKIKPKLPFALFSGWRFFQWIAQIKY